MLRKRERGQGLTEFALILPLLLLLLLGVIEASRIIWAGITVQAAAREAARYAVTGKPYVGSADSIYCSDYRGETADNPNVSSPISSDEYEPWICNDGTLRASAVISIALERGQTLNIAEECIGSGSFFDDPNVSGECADIPGAFGALVIGQIVDTTGITPTVVTETNHAGDQGLNVRVHTYYNVEMIDPIFDFVMGGRFIRLEGEVQMQNEGLDTVLGAVPPPPIPTLDITGGGSPGSSAASIIPNSTTVQQNTDLGIQLLQHTFGVTYSIHLKDETTGDDFVICPNPTVPTVAPAGNGSWSGSCRVNGSIVPVGDYRLSSNRFGITSPFAIYEESLVSVVAGSFPLIEVSDPDTSVPGDIWAINSDVQIELLNHNVSAQPFTVYFDKGGSDEQVIASGVNASDPPLNWTIPNVPGKCPQGGGSPCRIESWTASGQYAITEIFINNPEIVMQQDITEFAQGETMYFFLIGHTPNTKYDVQITRISPAPNAVVETRTNLQTDGFGNLTAPIVVPIPEDGSWLDGDYKITSHPGGNLSKEIASQDITLSTPAGPFITVDGGFTWPIDSFINIKVLQHTATTGHYLEFDGNRVPTQAADNTFDTNASGTATVGYRIPLTTTTGSPKVVDIESFINASDLSQATRQITVLPVPVINIVEGDTALADATITIQILNHSPKSSYTIYYGKTVGDPNSSGQSLFSFVTDGSGFAERKYSLKDLPNSLNFSPPPGCTFCFGTPYEMYSQSLAGDRLAFTELTIDSADLAVTKIEFPPDVQVNTTIPVTMTIENLSAVTVSRFFDIDFYLDPSPLVPAYTPDQFNFPGDVKRWENFVAPNGQLGYTFTITQDFFVGEYGDHTFYGYADTSDFIKAENSETNNLNDNIFTVSCTPPVIKDTFNSSASLANWSSKIYRTQQTEADPPQVNSGRLRLRSDGLSTAGTDDDASNRGHFLLYRTQPVTSTAGLDVMVQVVEAPTGSNYAKGGLSIRNSINDSQSIKIDYDLAWNSSTSKHRIQAMLRTTTGGNASGLIDSQEVNINTQGPVWLRVEREPSSNTFNFYYYLENNSGIPPTASDWVSYASATVPMNDQVYLGLFNASYSNNSYRVSRFDNFQYTDPSSCPAPQGQPSEEPPAGLTICTDLLQKTSFENPPFQEWFIPPEENVAVSPGGAHTGLFKLKAPTFEGSFNNPFFYQQFVMPEWVISSTTTFNATLWKNIDALGDDDPNDKFYVLVSTTKPDVSVTQITSPTLVAEGIGSANKWQFVNKNLDKLPVSTVNLEDYAGQTLYAYFYNNSNQAAGCPPFKPSCADSHFFFDDVQLTACTQQPKPTPAETLTQLQGTVTLNRLGGTTEKVAGVKVWAYSEGGDLFETFSIQNGEFVFYNLPASQSGIKYFIYAEYNIVDASDPTQIETLAANTTAVLKSFNDENSPVTINLDLFTVSQ